MHSRVARTIVLSAVLAVLPAVPADAGKPAPPALVVTGVTLIEAWGPAYVEVTRTGNLKKASSVTLTTKASDLGNAAGAGEFVAGSQVVSFPRRVSSVNVAVNAVDDAATEGVETFAVELTNPSNGVLGGGASDYVIVVDDDQPGTFTVPAGGQLLVQHLLLVGCNNLSASLVDAAGAPLATLASGSDCNPGQTVTSYLWPNDTGSPVTVRLALTDTGCGVTYLSDGTGPADHASAWDSTELFTPTGVSITDAGLDCDVQTTTRQPGAADPGNLQAAGVFVLT